MTVPTAAFLSTCQEFITGKVLDAGCGSKPYKRMFPRCEWVGVDTRPVGDVQADIHQLPFEDDSFDSVLCTEVLSECSWPQVVMKELARVLKPGGYIVVSTPNTTAEDESAFFTIKLAGMKALMEMAGLQGVKIGVEGRLFKQEWQDFSRYSKYGMGQPEDLEGWLRQMDERYPSVTIAVARKENGDVELDDPQG